MADSNDLEARFVEIENKMDHSEHDLKAKLAEVEKRFNDIETSLESVKSQLHRNLLPLIDNRFKKIESRLNVYDRSPRIRDLINPADFAGPKVVLQPMAEGAVKADAEKLAAQKADTAAAQGGSEGGGRRRRRRSKTRSRRHRSKSRSRRHHSRRHHSRRRR